MKALGPKYNPGIELMLNTLRPVFNFSPRGEILYLGVKLAPRGELCPLGVKLSPWDKDPMFTPPFF
jgi:hypothetical protein